LLAPLLLPLSACGFCFARLVEGEESGGGERGGGDAATAAAMRKVEIAAGTGSCGGAMGVVMRGPVAFEWERGAGKGVEQEARARARGRGPLLLQGFLCQRRKKPFARPRLSPRHIPSPFRAQEQRGLGSRLCAPIPIGGRWLRSPCKRRRGPDASSSTGEEGMGRRCGGAGCWCGCCCCCWPRRRPRRGAGRGGAGPPARTLRPASARARSTTAARRASFLSSLSPHQKGRGFGSVGSLSLWLGARWRGD